MLRSSSVFEAHAACKAAVTHLQIAGQPHQLLTGARAATFQAETDAAEREVRAALIDAEAIAAQCSGEETQSSQIAALRRRLDAAKQRALEAQARILALSDDDLIDLSRAHCSFDSDERLIRSAIAGSEPEVTALIARLIRACIHSFVNGRVTSADMKLDRAFRTFNEAYRVVSVARTTASLGSMAKTLSQTLREATLALLHTLEVLAGYLQMLAVFVSTIRVQWPPAAMELTHALAALLHFRALSAFPTWLVSATQHWLDELHAASVQLLTASNHIFALLFPSLHVQLSLPPIVLPSDQSYVGLAAWAAATMAAYPLLYSMLFSWPAANTYVRDDHRWKPERIWIPSFWDGTCATAACNWVSWLAAGGGLTLAWGRLSPRHEMMWALALIMGFLTLTWGLASRPASIEDMEVETVQHVQYQLIDVIEMPAAARSRILPAIRHTCSAPGCFSRASRVLLLRACVATALFLALGTSIQSGLLSVVVFSNPLAALIALASRGAFNLSAMSDGIWLALWMLFMALPTLVAMAALLILAAVHLGRSALLFLRSSGPNGRSVRSLLLEVMRDFAAIKSRLVLFVMTLVYAPITLSLLRALFPTSGDAVVTEDQNSTGIFICYKAAFPPHSSALVQPAPKDPFEAQHRCSPAVLTAVRMSSYVTLGLVALGVPLSLLWLAHEATCQHAQREGAEANHLPTHVLRGLPALDAASFSWMTGPFEQHLSFWKAVMLVERLCYLLIAHLIHTQESRAQALLSLSAISLATVITVKHTRRVRSR
jgi:hypothetical protein